MHLDLKNGTPNGELGIIALESCHQLGDKINYYLSKKRNDNLNSDDYLSENFLISTEEVRFSNGEGKVVIDESVRGKDIFIIADVGNYSNTYEMFGFKNHKGPDEHFQDIKRAVSALGGRARRVTVIMPMLYESRQHRRKGRESLDCALALQELERLGVQNIITFDVHDPNVQNAIPLISFQNLYPTYEIVKTFIKEEKDLSFHNSNMIVISPDTGAMDRSIYYSSVLGLDVGLFYKRRDYSKVIAGKNPIVEHEYIGKNIEGLDILITDDMIASGESVFDIVKELKERKANRVYVAVTFALFTEGIEKFNEFYEKGLIEKVYATNLTYIPEEVKKYRWFKEVDMSKFLATILDYINRDESIAPVIDATESIKKLLK
ncbi:ribose-phosphate pyrophosphokinase [Clostridium sp. D2Q-11]|uniref:ribose-phosphate diphosphokinase n=1 Tax=Anaeromonas frigoriresistens TaxID=2683708 RepID=A0A942Z7A7_9FIRM|nr:ribose-phosphate pyrophosphokinase [Anaeromonas frigoriresistens]